MSVYRVRVRGGNLLLSKLKEIPSRHGVICVIHVEADSLESAQEEALNVIDIEIRRALLDPETDYSMYGVESTEDIGACPEEGCPANVYEWYEEDESEDWLI